MLFLLTGMTGSSLQFTKELARSSSSLAESTADVALRGRLALTVQDSNESRNPHICHVHCLMLL